MTYNIHVNTQRDAIYMVEKEMNCNANNRMYIDFEQSKRAGYNIWRTYHNDIYACFLGTRYEINYENGDSLNIWLDYLRRDY